VRAPSKRPVQEFHRTEFENRMVSTTASAETAQGDQRLCVLSIAARDPDTKSVFASSLPHARDQFDACSFAVSYSPTNCPLAAL